MDGILDCLICKEGYDYDIKLPKILSCGHTLCKQCISNLHAFEGSVRCPLDREAEQKDIFRLPTNFALLQIQDLKNTGLKTKERCPVHRYPVTMICRTCNMNCCPQCIRKHTTHDLFDTENAEILEAIANRISVFETKITENFSQVSDAEKRVLFEIDTLKEQEKILKTEISEYFSSLRNMINVKENESVSLLERNVNEKLDTLTIKRSNIDEQKSYYERFIKDLQLVKREFSDKSFIDRSVTCMNLLQPFDNLKKAVVPELSSLKSRIKLDSSQVFTSSLGDILIKEDAPLDLLIEKCASKLKKISGSLNEYLTGNCETRLQIQTQSMSHYVLILTRDLEMTEEHVFLEQIGKIFGVKYKELDVDTRSKIPLTLGFNFKLFEKGLRDRVIFVYGIIEAVNLIREKEWENALKVLHYLIIKYSDFELAELLMNALILKITEQAKKIIKSIRVQEIIYLLNLASMYLQYHLLPSHPVFKKFFKLISVILKENDDVLYGIQHKNILQTTQAIVWRLNSSEDFNLQVEVPSSFQTEIDRLQKIRFKFWSNSKLPTILSLKLTEAKEELGVWWKTAYSNHDQDLKFEELAQIYSNQ